MGIFGAMSTAVTGLRAQSFALENISGNIANSQTTAFKREDTSFIDLIPDNIPSRQLAGNVIANSRATNSVQGDIQNSSIGTYMAINGPGFFVIEKPTGYAGGQPAFGGVDTYTRRGDFSPDQNGYLVNGAGYYLKGIPIDATTGNVVGSVPQLLQFSTGFLPAQATTVVRYQANLASYPQTAASDPATPQSELLDPADYSVDPTVAGAGTVVGDDIGVFIDNSIGGGALTCYDVSGSPVNMQLRWAKIDSSLYGGTDTWNLFYQVDPSAVGGATAWQNVGVDYEFAANGQMDPPVASTSVTGVTINGVLIGDVNFQHTSAGLTQFADSGGQARVNLLQQDGFPAGVLQTVSVSDKGRVVGTYSNSRTVDLAEITLANFTGANMLKRIDGGAFSSTAESGQPTYNATGKIVGASLEGSNADIADEFTKLIITQQAYSANTRVISTSNQMVQDMLSMLR